MRRRHASRSSASVVCSLLTVLIGCEPGTSGKFGQVRAQLRGQVVQVGSLTPVAGEAVTFAIPISGICGDVALAPIISSPSDVLTDAEGRYSALVTIFAHSPREYCVRVTAAGVSGDAPAVLFRTIEVTQIDTVVVDLTVP